ncbi:hypothetical protein RR48_07051 [Papilio machaon]|uniref:Uncharacterized protein n=1 Tax=Papilio machaon TaxID=76193 RepID=A0A194RC37_PAPMA|nr:hypothetical protein RR48_07051 [Papilio machaon]
MKVIVLYFMVLQNCLQIALPQELSTEPTDNVTQENDRSTTTYRSTKNSVGNESNDPGEKNPYFESLSSSNPTNDEETNNGLDYPFKTLMRLLKVKGSVTDSFDGASKIFGGMQDVGGE